MAQAFDPYHKWLGIAPRDQPPNHYRLLGIDELESDPEVISAASDMRMAHVRSYQSGKRSLQSQKLLNEIAAARVCLLDSQKKAEYDSLLQKQLRPEPGPPQSISVRQVEAEADRAAKLSVAPREEEMGRRGGAAPPLPGSTKLDAGAFRLKVSARSGRKKPSGGVRVLLGSLGSALMICFRGVDDLLRSIASGHSPAVHKGLRVAACALVLLVAAGGFYIWLGGEPEADVSADRFAETVVLPVWDGGGQAPDASANTAPDANANTPAQLDLPPPSGKGKLLSIGPRTYEVREVRANDHTRQKQHHASLAALTDGGFLVGWDSWHQTRSTDCYGKRFSADGTAMGKEFLLNANNSSGWEYGTALAAGHGGGLLAAWGDTSRDTCIQRFDCNMRSVGKDWVVMGDSWPALSSAPNGDFVVVGTTRRDRVHNICARRYSPEGEPLGETRQVNTKPLGFTTENLFGAAVAHAGDGSFTIVWYDAAGDILARRYDAGGTPRGIEFVVNSSTGGRRIEPGLAYARDEELLVVWHEFGGDTGDRICARHFRAEGVPAADEWTVAAGAVSCPNLAIGPTNEFAIAWRAGDPQGADIHARLFGATGQPVGQAFRVNQHTQGEQLTAFCAGRQGMAIIDQTLVFAWYGNAPGDNEGIGLTVFRRVSSRPGASPPPTFVAKPSTPPAAKKEPKHTESAKDWRTDYAAFRAKIQEIIAKHAPTSPPTQDSALVTFFALETETEMMYILYHGTKLAKVYEEIEGAFGGKSIRWQGTVEDVEDKDDGKTVTVRLCEKNPTAHGWSFPSTFDVFVSASDFARLPVQLKGKRVELSGDIVSKPDIDGKNVMSGIVLMYGVNKYAGEKMVLVNLEEESVKPIR